MKTLFDKVILKEILDRIDKLQPTSQRQWGKMNAAQMLAHCSETFEVATGQKLLPMTIAGRLFGWMLKSFYAGAKPFSKNSPTDKSFIVSDVRVFDHEKDRLIKLVNQFSEGGEEKCTTQPHCFFGKLTPAEWGIGMYKHMDHHLRQFNV